MTTSFPTSSASSAYTTPPNSQGNMPFSPVEPGVGALSNRSPASPHSSFMFPHCSQPTRQLRPPKSPMYIPAALRPTERPHRPSPLTPPRSVNNSTDSLNRNEAGGSLSRRSTGDSLPHERLSPVDDQLGTIEGLPTRSHWKPDHNALICDAPTCRKSFSLFERRHHCRHCGHVFCATHSPYIIPLDHRAEFHPDGTCSRACKHCWDRYCSWNSQRLTASVATDTPEASGESGRNIEGRGTDRDGLRGGLAGSMPRDWSWSTF
ncbi:hypothetical protein MMC07_006415 [Pseudocyphellaria aurata]|nr:hypothetical protein [Pseudocyphellaria aurata]